MHCMGKENVYYLNLWEESIRFVTAFKQENTVAPAECYWYKYQKDI